MRCITIWQPWASLIAYGYKRYETRSWKTNYRGPIAIHAGKKIDHQAVMMVARNYPEIWREISPLPTGCILAVVELTECWEIIGEADVPVPRTKVLSAGCRMFGMPSSTNEHQFGNYEQGRYAWELANVQRIEPIPMKGQQGLWNWGGERDASRT